MEPGTERTVHAMTLPALLQKAGYRTIHVGKAHFAAHGTLSEDPRNLGFDVNIAGCCAAGPGSYHGKNNFSGAFRKGDRICSKPGLEMYHGQDINLTEALTLEANKAVNQAVADGKPFYLYMSHYAVHAPWEKDDRFLETYTSAGLKGLQAVYASMIEGMDKSLGDIMANLKRQGLEENTVVVFMSDNGCPRKLPRNLPLRGHKLTPYEGGTRVPMIVKWPGVVEPNSLCAKDYVIIEDIFPTFLELAGVQEYQQNTGTTDGKSFAPLLKGNKGFSNGRAIFWHYPHT
jgi:arylsulfatase A-like enzyme